MKTRDAGAFRIGLGYAAALGAAGTFAIGGVIGKALLRVGVLPSELAELRILFGFLAFLAIGAAFLRRDLLVRWRDLPLLISFGVFALGGIQWAYYEAIARMPIGVALVIQYLGSLLMLLYLRWRGLRVGRALWIAVGLALAGTALLVGAYDPSVLSLNLAGLPIAALAAVIFAVYFLMAERILARYSVLTLLVYGFGAALAAWVAVRPPGLLPWRLFADPTNAALLLGVVVVATVVPFALIFASLSLIPAARAGVMSMAEPVFAAVAAWVALGEGLEWPQIGGGLLVLAAIALVQTSRLREGGV